MSHGFILVREEHLTEVGGKVRLWKHKATGAELLSVVNRDENKSFGVCFRTPPKDSTGVAHILEHSVLCGSRRYPVKEPFVELLKSSLQTFLNALTFPDKTCYPVASTNLQDFYNLVDVYVDAVFYPRIDENVLRQEGWHIDVDENDVWTYKGVVFNEMKGVYSSPDSVLMEASQHAVFPDMLYSLDSGGDPAEILNLTYEAFRDFHSRYYHPANARFFFWGDDPEETRLEKIGTLLADFGPCEVDSAIPLQSHRELGHRVEVPYAAESDEEEARGHVTVNWLLCENSDIEEALVLEMLEHILTGLPGSPLRKALMDSGLGEDITGAGMEMDLRQIYFSLGLRSIRPEDAPAVETLIVDTLTTLAERGIATKAVDAALNCLEFELRENNTGRFPRGLAALFHSLTTWLYDGDPFAPLAWEAPLASIKTRLAAGEKVFENAIRRWFLENHHRITVVLKPDTGLAAARQTVEDRRLAQAREAMSEAERVETARISLDLREAQERPDSPEALATIPSLGREDLPLKNRILPYGLSTTVSGVPLILHELDTTGILYARLLLPLDAVPENLLPLVHLYARALTEMGTARRDYVELGLELAAQTGSLGAFPVLQTRLTDASAMAVLDVTGKATVDKAQRLAELMAEILLQPTFNLRDRFLQMVLEEKARLEQGLIPSGHLLVKTRLDGSLSATGRLGEMCSGVSYLFFIRELAKRVENNWPQVLEELISLHRLIVRQDKALISLTGDHDLLFQTRPMFSGVAANLPLRPETDIRRLPPERHSAEVLLTPAQVNYVGLGMNLHENGYRHHGSSAVILRHLRMGYLWDRVRVLGGAYGAYANYSRASGSMIFLSYRDPNVERTLDIFRGAADYLADLRLPAEEITKAVVGAIGDMDAYLLPGAKGSTALWRYLTRDTEETRQRIRDEILSTSLKDFHDFAPYLAKALETAIPCVLGGNAAETAADRQGWNKLRVL